MKFRKLPVEIEAVQWTGTNERGQNNIHEIFEALGEFHFSSWTDELYIRTLEGEMTAKKGDWIIKGVRGEIYPCKDNVFKLTYEAV
jgi:hypothetical protein